MSRFPTISNTLHHSSSAFHVTHYRYGRVSVKAVRRVEDSEGVASVVSVTDSEEEEQKATDRFRDFVQKKGVLTLSFHGV